MCASIARTSRGASRSVIVYLTQNTAFKRTNLIHSLQRLFWSFNAKSRHPVVIFHEGDYDETAKASVRAALPLACARLVRFQHIHPSDFIPPAGVDSSVVAAARHLVSDPRGMSYRSMCRWWMVHLPKYLSEYDIYLRLDDDLFLNGKMPDPVIVASEAGLDYASNCIHIEHPLNALGLSAFAVQLWGRTNNARALCLPAQMSPDMAQKIEAFSQSLPKALQGLIAPDAVSTPIMYYNNFHIMHRRVWSHPDWTSYVTSIETSQAQYHLRWGDAPLQTLGLAALGFRAERFEMSYSKRHERQHGAYINTCHDSAAQFFGGRKLGGRTRVGCMTEFSAFRDHIRAQNLQGFTGVVGRQRRHQMFWGEQFWRPQAHPHSGQS